MVIMHALELAVSVTVLGVAFCLFCVCFFLFCFSGSYGAGISKSRFVVLRGNVKLEQNGWKPQKMCLLINQQIIILITISKRPFLYSSKRRAWVGGGGGGKEGKWV